MDSSLSKKAIKSLSFLWMGSLLGSGSTFVIYMILARKLGPEDFGVFSSALSMVTIFTMLAGFGVGEVWLKLFGKEGWQGIRWIKPSLHFVFISLVGATVLLAVWALYGSHDKTTQSLLLIMIFFIFGNVAVQLIVSKLQLEERYDYLALWQLAPNIIRLIIIVICFFILSISLSVIDIAYIYAGVGALFTIFGIYQLNCMQKGRFDLKGHEKTMVKEAITPTLKDIITEAWPFGMASLFAFIYVQSDIILIKYLAGDTEAGYYNVAFVIITAILIFPTVLYSKFLMPKFHRWANYDRDKFYQVYKKGNIAMLVSGSIAMVGILFLSGWMIPLLFGIEYQKSVVLINILAFTMPIYFVSYSIASTLVTQKHIRKKIKYMGLIAIINIVLNIVLIPYYGANGAAIATLISYFILLSVYYYASQKYVFATEAAKGNK